MQRIDFYFDVISPYAWLAFERLPQVLQGQHHRVDYRPVLLAGVLGHWGQKGPAEITPKRAWTYRQVAWLAQQQGSTLQLPQPHPFNPLALMRLALAAAPSGGTPSRRVVELLFRHVWCREGADPNQPEALAALAQAVAPQREPACAEVKAELREATDAALALGVFGVPSMAHQGRLFFGADALPMLAASVAGDAWFNGPAWQQAAEQPEGVTRNR